MMHSTVLDVVIGFVVVAPALVVLWRRRSRRRSGDLDPGRVVIATNLADSRRG
jgi:hypothetical protein